jgi:hypothetical protein
MSFQRERKKTEKQWLLPVAQLLRKKEREKARERERKKREERERREREGERKRRGIVDPISHR